MALTRRKRGRSQRKTEEKITQNRRSVGSEEVQENIPTSSLSKNVDNEKGLETGESADEFVHSSDGAAAGSSGTMTVLVPETPGEQNDGPAVEELSDDSDTSNDSFPQFVIDSKPDLRLNMEESDLENDNNDSDPGFTFVIDKIGSSSKFSHMRIDEANESDSENLKDGEKSSLKEGSMKKSKEQETRKQKHSQEKKSLPSLDAPCEIDVGMDLGDCYINLDGEDAMSSKTAVENILLKSRKDELIKKSVLTPDFEKKHSIPPYKVGIRQLKKQRKKERESTKGDGWFDMKAPEMTEELRNDLKIIKMRSILDPKRFYKGNDMPAIPKFVQVGTVVDSPVDFYHSRVPKKQRKQTLVDELLADSDTRRYNKRKYIELQEKINSIPKGQKKHKFGKKKDGKKR
ncbi:deoxynucleotidyltransferase terminal-interacting protein 2-like [Lytechinus variegatus]|uniref:deoxynucleotidyltransferase terminal-interacting protein 2-like n=1 Tax=Lytechinus variegatus TaxID=7654 RepID=UPI001BB14DCC|nr:deoxynucleotidyltransferase terminal-interacting protein 2-like [Lytechinus variegatus]